MAGEVATAWVTLLPSFKGGASAISSEIDQPATAAGKSAGGKFSKGFGGAIGGLGTMVAGTMAVGAVTDFFGSAIAGASDLNETVNKSRTIFGAQAADIEKWAGSAATTMGLSKQAALDAAAGFGDMFSQIGFAGDEAAKMSQDVVQMSADLGSFNNLPTEDVAGRLSAAFRGEYDSLQALIPNINAARVEQEALSATGKKSASELTAQEKAAAVLAIVHSDGARAAGDFAKTSDGLANKQKTLSAKMADLKAKAGDALLPALEKLAGVGEKVIDFITENASVIGPLVVALGILAGIIAAVAIAQWAWNAAIAFTMWPVVAIVAGILLLVGIIILLVKNWDKVWATIKAGFSWIADNWPMLLAILTGPIGLAVKFIVDHWDQIVAFVKELPGRIAEAGAAIWNWITEKLTELWNAAVEIWNGIIDWVTGIPGKIADAGAAIWDWVSDKADDAFDALGDWLDDVLAWVGGLPGKLADAAGDIWGWLLDKAEDIWEDIKDVFSWDSLMHMGGKLNPLNWFGGGSKSAPADATGPAARAGSSDAMTTGAGRVGRMTRQQHLAAQIAGAAREIIDADADQGVRSYTYAPTFINPPGVPAAWDDAARAHDLFLAVASR